MRWPTIPAPEKGGNIIDQDAVNRLVDYAIAHGVNYFDTSPVYVQGWSEKSTGIALKRHPREKLIIATKLSNFQNWTRENSIAMYKQSLKDLQTDYIDYYLLHSIGNGGIETFRARYIDNGMLDYLIEERKAGRIRNLGFSFHGTVDVFDEVLAMHDHVHWDFVQIQLNYVDWRHASGRNVNAEYLYAELEKRGIPAIIMEPLLGGRLADRLPDRARRILEAAATPELASPAAWGLSWVWDHPEVTMLLSGMAAPEQVDENAAIAERALPGSLTPAQHEAIARVVAEFERVNRVRCTGCNYCMPCPQGINIPGSFSAYNASYAHGWFSGAWQYYAASAVRTSEPRLVSNCVGCGACAARCPQHIDIPARLADVGRRFQPGPVGWALKAWSRRPDSK